MTLTHEQVITLANKLLAGCKCSSGRLQFTDQKQWGFYDFVFAPSHSDIRLRLYDTTPGEPHEWLAMTHLSEEQCGQPLREAWEDLNAAVRELLNGSAVEPARAKENDDET